MTRKPPEHFFEQIMKKPTKVLTTELAALDRMLDWLGDRSKHILDYKSTIKTKVEAYLNQKGEKAFYQLGEVSLSEMDALYSIGIDDQSILDELFLKLKDKTLKLKCVVLCLETLDYTKYFRESNLHLVHDETFVIDKKTYKGLVFSVYEN